MTHILALEHISLSKLTTVDPDSYESPKHITVVATVQCEQRFRLSFML